MSRLRFPRLVFRERHLFPVCCRYLSHTRRHASSPTRCPQAGSVSAINDEALRTHAQQQCGTPFQRYSCEVEDIFQYPPQCGHSPRRLAPLLRPSPSTSRLPTSLFVPATCVASATTLSTLLGEAEVVPPSEEEDLVLVLGDLEEGRRCCFLAVR